MAVSATPTVAERVFAAVGWSMRQPLGSNLTGRKNFPVEIMGLQKGVTYKAIEVDLKIKILDFLPSGQIQAEYTRNGYSQIVQYSPAQIVPYLTDESLYTTDQLKLF